MKAPTTAELMAAVRIVVCRRTREVLAEFGYSDDDVDGLVEKGVICDERKR